MAKREGYRFSIRWIAENDEPACDNVEEMAGLVSVCLLADMFGKTPEAVAADIIRYRVSETTR